MTSQEYEYFKNYNMNTQETEHCCKIIESVDKYKNSSRQLHHGFPRYLSSDFTQGYALGSIMCIKRDVGFDYYLLTVNEKGNIDCIDFQQFIHIYEKEYNNVIPMDAFIYFLISKIDNYNNQNNQIYIHKGHIVKAHLSENGKYRLELLHTYDSDMEQDNASYKTGYGEPIYDKITCFCKAEFFFCDKNIPNGSKYEIRCPNCKASLMRKKSD